LHFNGEIGQAKTFRSQPVHPGRFSSSDDAASIKTGLPPAEVVKEDKYNIRFVLSEGSGT
jgi:hypothetical protein